MKRILKFPLLLILLSILSGVLSAQVYITTGQQGQNVKIPQNWTFTAPTSYLFGGGYFDMSVTTGHDYTVNVRANDASGILLSSVNLTAAQLCAQPAGCSGQFNNH